MTPPSRASEAESDLAGSRVGIRPLQSDAEARACARIMSTSDPWLTLGRDFDRSLAVITASDREVYVVLAGADVVGFLILCMQGAFVGYVQTVAVREDWRSRGLGRRLLAFAEERIFREWPNVFLCVSSFNVRARALYERLGYRLVGELTDYVVAGHAELLLRKSVGPLTAYRVAGSPERS